MTKFDASNTDAQYWADEFIKILNENPGIAHDEGAMIGWFANAIMAGYDEARRKYEMVNFHDFLMRMCEEQIAIAEFEMKKKSYDAARTD